MSVFARILGYLIVVLYLLAATNGLKRYTKNQAIRAIARNHKLFGALASLVAITHFIVNLINGNTNVFGFLTLVLLITTGALGGAFKQTKNKALYKAHRIVGPLVLVALVVHLISIYTA
jgi:NADH:ubiquinone oxidoreductase subunit 2 (subunit N)